MRRQARSGQSNRIASDRRRPTRTQRILGWMGQMQQQQQQPPIQLGASADSTAPPSIAALLAIVTRFADGSGEGSTKSALSASARLSLAQLTGALRAVGLRVHGRRAGSVQMQGQRPRRRPARLRRARGSGWGLSGNSPPVVILSRAHIAVLNAVRQMARWRAHL